MRKFYVLLLVVLALAAQFSPALGHGPSVGEAIAEWRQRGSPTIFDFQSEVLTSERTYFPRPVPQQSGPACVIYAMAYAAGPRTNPEAVARTYFAAEPDQASAIPIRVARIIERQTGRAYQRYSFLLPNHTCDLCEEFVNPGIAYAQYSAETRRVMQRLSSALTVFVVYPYGDDGLSHAIAVVRIDKQWAYFAQSSDGSMKKIALDDLIWLMLWGNGWISWFK